MKEKDKNKRIKTELDRIKIYFEDLKENEKAVIDPLLQNSAFMKITLEDLQELINQDGVIDIYQNGANQSGTKQSATLQSYNSLIKNYASVTKTLFGLLPPEKRPAVSPWIREPQVKTEEEIEEEKLKEEERQQRIREEIEKAVKLQREQWKKEGREFKE